MQETLVRLGSRLEELQLRIGSVLMIGLTLTVFADVIFRETDYPIVWLQDLTRFIFMWTIYIGMAIGIRRGTHYRIDLFPAATPKAVVRALAVFSYICQIAFASLLLIYGVDFALVTKDRLAMPSEFPVMYQAISIPVSAVFMLYYLVEGARNAFYGDVTGHSFNVD